MCIFWGGRGDNKDCGTSPQLLLFLWTKANSRGISAIPGKLACLSRLPCYNLGYPHSYAINFATCFRTLQQRPFTRCSNNLTAHIRFVMFPQNRLAQLRCNYSHSCVVATQATHTHVLQFTSVTLSCRYACCTADKLSLYKKVVVAPMGFSPPHSSS